jgi:hypothetical protein
MLLPWLRVDLVMDSIQQSTLARYLDPNSAPATVPTAALSGSARLA